MARVLLVDDDTELCEMLTEYLGPEGFEVDAAYDGKQGARQAVTGHYDVVLLDIMLPRLNGLDTLRHIRRESQIPVPMLTAKGDDVDRIVGLELGADDYLAKPFNPRELVARLRAVLRRSGYSGVWTGWGQGGGVQPAVVAVGDALVRPGERVAERVAEWCGQPLALQARHAARRTLADPNGAGCGLPVCQGIGAWAACFGRSSAVAEDARFEAEASARRIELRTAPEVIVKGHAELLHRAFENVLRNAIRYTAPGTAVDIFMERDGARVRVSICDRGPGVPEADLDAIFRPFSRVIAVPPAMRGSYGLGLAIAKRAIEAHAGRIYAENRPDGGLCVRVELALAAGFPSEN
jgi:DNA-binding response OmpR family regulator/anti-sigma regulatory factor (Ser/Thr protein kinase)